MMKKNLVTILAAAVVFSGAPAVGLTQGSGFGGSPTFQGGSGEHGEGGRGSMGRHRRGRDSIPSNRFLENVLELTSDQLAEVDELRAETREALKAVGSQIRDQRDALRTELDGENPSPNSVGEKVIEIHDLQGQGRSVRESARQAFEAILTPEQLETLQEFGDRRRGGRGRRSPRG